MDASLLAARMTATRPLAGLAPTVPRDDRDKHSDTRDIRDKHSGTRDIRDDLSETRDNRDDLSDTRDDRAAPGPSVSVMSSALALCLFRRTLCPAQFVVIRVIRGKSPTACLTFHPRAAKITAYSAGAGRSSA